MRAKHDLRTCVDCCTPLPTLEVPSFWLKTGITFSWALPILWVAHPFCLVIDTSHSAVRACLQRHSLGGFSWGWRMSPLTYLLRPTFPC